MLQKTEHDLLLDEEFALRSGTRVRIRWLPHCRRLEETYEKALAQRSTFPLHSDETYVLEFNAGRYTIYAVVTQGCIRETVKYLKQNLVYEAFLASASMRFRRRWYWWDDSFYTVLEQAILENLSPYLVPLVGETSDDE